MEIKNISYANSKTKYEDIVEDLTNFYDWDNITSGSQSTTFKKEYSDDNGYAGLTVSRFSSSNDFYISIVGNINNDGGIVSNYINVKSDINIFNYAIGDNGILLSCFPNSAPPTEYSTPFGVFGVVKGTNILTGETNFCSFLINYYTNSAQPLLRIISKDTINIDDFTIKWKTELHQFFDTTLPIIAPTKTPYEIDKIKMKICARDNYFYTNGNLTFNGNTYYGMGNIMIPTDF